jgi:hypothetical protein
VLLAPLAMAAGPDAIFILTPIAGALLVWLTFLAGRRIAGPLAGAMAAVLVSARPPMLYQVVQPMNDVTTAALWMGTSRAYRAALDDCRHLLRPRASRAAKPSTARRRCGRIRDRRSQRDPRR